MLIGGWWCSRWEPQSRKESLSTTSTPAGEEHIHSENVAVLGATLHSRCITRRRSPKKNTNDWAHALHVPILVRAWAESVQGDAISASVVRSTTSLRKRRPQGTLTCGGRCGKAESRSQMARTYWMRIVCWKTCWHCHGAAKCVGRKGSCIDGSSSSRPILIHLPSLSLSSLVSQQRRERQKRSMMRAAKTGQYDGNDVTVQDQ